MATDPSPSCRKTRVGFSDGGGPKACASMVVPETSSFPRNGHIVVTAFQRPMLERTCWLLSDGGKLDQLLRVSDARSRASGRRQSERQAAPAGGGEERADAGELR